MARARSGLCYGLTVHLCVCCASFFLWKVHFSYHKHWLHCPGNISTSCCARDLDCAASGIETSFSCRAGWNLLGPLLQLVPVACRLGSVGGEGAWWLVALVISAMLARVGVDIGAPGEVQSSQTMFRLSSSTTEPTKCCFHAWKAPCFHVCLRRAILRPFVVKLPYILLHSSLYISRYCAWWLI